MQAAASTQLPRPRLVRVVVKWLLVAFLAAWTVVASVYLLIHAVIVPRIDIWRADIAHQLSKSIGAPVQIGSLSASASQWTSYFVARDVAVGQDGAAPDLFIPKLEVSLSMGGLWRLEFDQVRISSPSVQVVRGSAGMWRVAGFDLPAHDKAVQAPWQDWLFGQPELLMTDARVVLRDELVQLATAPNAWVIQHVDVALRSSARSHSARIDLTPPAHWGQRLSVQAQFESPLFSVHSGDWRQWAGTAYAQWPQLDMPAVQRVLNRFVPSLPANLELSTANGAWRGWLEFERGAQIASLTSDLALSDVAATWTPDNDKPLKPLSFKRLQARVSLSQTVTNSPGGDPIPSWLWAVSDMAFETQQGVRWDGAQLDVTWPKRVAQPNGVSEPRTGARLASIDVDVLRQLAPSLPLPEAVRAQLNSWQPTGYINELRADWQGAFNQPISWTSSGQATELGWAPGSLSDAGNRAELTRPGVQGLSVRWNGSSQGGSAQLAVNKGQWTLPGVWLEPELAVPSMQAQVQWAAPGQLLASAATPPTWQADDWQQLWRVAFEQVQIETPDGQVSANGVWAVDVAHALTNRAGYLALDAGVERLSLDKLSRYLPRAMNQEAWDFVQRRLQTGTLSQVRVAIQSQLDNTLWQGGAKRFAIRAQADDVALDYAASLGPAQRWPAVAAMSGSFAMSGLDIDITDIKARLRDAPQVVVSRASVGLRDLATSARLSVDVAASGPLQTWLDQLDATPVARWTDGMMHDWRGTGDASLSLNIATPLGEQAKTGGELEVDGEVLLQDVSLQLWPSVPALQQAQARIRFGNNRVEVDQAKALWLGSPLAGDMRWQASTNGQGPGTLQVNASGTLSASAVARTPSLGSAAVLAQRASGSTTFEASARSTADGLAWTLRAPMTNLRLNLPPPLNKASGDTWPLSMSVTPLPASKRSAGMASGQAILLSVGPARAPVVYGHFEREFKALDNLPAHAGVPDALRGVMGLGKVDASELDLPTQGVSLDVRLASFNVDAWRQVLNASGSPTVMSAVAGVDMALSGVGATEPLRHQGVGDTAMATQLRAYLPTSMVARALELTVQGRTFNNVVMGGARVGPLWRANVRADELNGYVQYREPDASDASDAGAGNLYARLAMLNLAKQESQELVQMLSEQPQAMPALDVVVQALTLGGRDLGRLELQAFNRVVERVAGQPANEWRLNRLWLDVPEASLRANGQWAPVLPSDSADFDATRRRTFLELDLELRDSGALLARFGMPGVVRGSQGTLKGQLAWLGAPTNFDTKSLSGGLDLAVSSGQFLKADPGIARLLGVLSLQSLPRRLLLDFRDVFLEGFAFDSVAGNARINNGVVQTNNLRMAGVSATVLMEGQASVVDETQDLQVVVVPQVDAGALSLLAVSANPLVGVATYFLERVFGQAINTANTKAFQVTGSWAQPKVHEVSLSPRQGKAPVQTIDVSQQAAQAVKQLGAGAATVSTEPLGATPAPAQ